MHKLSIVIIAYNEENRIRKTLESAKWCDEIIVVDSGSTDKTVDICREYSNCKIYFQSFLGYGLQKKFAVEKASNDWILSIDADEVITEALQQEIMTLLLNPSADAGYYVPITLIFMNKTFNYGSENKRFFLRFFNKNKGGFNTVALHEGIKVEGTTSKLKNEILHCSYSDIHHYFQKSNEYSSLYATEAFKKGKNGGIFMSVFRFPFEFCKQYFIRRNFLNGYPGFVWSAFSAFSVFVKFTKLYEKKNLV